MTEKQMKRVSVTAISIGIALQIIVPFDALIELEEPHLAAFYLSSLPLLLIGYYLGLQRKGYRPYRMLSFYGLALAVLVPYIGSVAIARKLFFTPQQGLAADKKSWQVSLWAVAMLLALLFCIILVGLPPTISYRQKGQVWVHIHHARELIAHSQQPGDDAKARSGSLAVARKELDAALHCAEKFGYGESADGRILYLSGELHRLRREWDEAEKDYANALNVLTTTTFEREEIISQAKLGLAAVKEARKKAIQ